MRKVIPINYGWKYYHNILGNYPAENIGDVFEKVDIPHTFVMLPFNNFDENDTLMVSLYTKEITVSENDLKGCVLLRFYGVSNSAIVYINKVFAFSHKGGYTMFEEDISPFLSKGKNEIEVVVDSREREDVPPFGNVVDYLGYGGIYREVELIITPKTYIKYVQIVCENPLMQDKEFFGKIFLNRKDKGKVEIKVYYNKVLCEKVVEEFDSDTIEVKGIVKNGILWDIDNPVLYEFVVNLIGIDDEVRENYGFRKAEFTKKGFFLNGKKLKLIGLNRHQSYPYVGYAMPKSIQEEDANYLKNTLKVNIVRTSHYPQSFHFIRKCDEIGLLVFTEAPGWQHIGGDDFKETFKQNVREMVTQYRNHPSIIIWGVRVNESPDCDQLYKETNEIAHNLDKTRQTGGVRNFGGSNLLEDVYTYNDFIHNGISKPLEKPIKITKKKSPYLVTENNGHMFPTKRYDIEKRRVEHALRHTRVINEAYKNDNICGEIGWCMADYNTHKDFGSGDKVCYHGVADMFRIEKLAAAPFISQNSSEPYLEPSCNMATGDYNETFMEGFYVYTNCDEIKLYKNGVHIDTRYKNESPFKSMPHPPIYFPDVIGNSIENDGKFSKRDSKRLRKVLAYIAGHGLYKMPIRHYITVGLICLKYKIKFKEVYYHFGKYLTSWGDKECVYKFEGYINGEKVIEKEKSQVKVKHYEYNVTNLNLQHKDTYDVAEVKILAKSETDNILSYCFDGITLSTTGCIEVLGDKHISLVGGCVGVYVRSTKKGMGTLTLTSDLERKEIRFTVE